MFVLSAEGPGYRDKGNWTTHIVVSIGKTKDDVIKDIDWVIGDDEVVIVTDLKERKAERVMPEDLPTITDES